MKNSCKVQIKDYQIIKKMSLDFVPGLNVIVGPSNNGKSSIIKAVKALVYTTPGGTPIRSGQSCYVVGMSYLGHTVILQKGLKESAYIVDGEKYSKYGTNTPPAVKDALNIRELDLNGKKEQLNFWDQLNYPFLLDKTPTELFRFIVDSGDNDQISLALKNMVSDRQSLNKKIDQIQGAINTVDLDIDNYEKQLDSAQSTIDTCNKILDLLPAVGRYRLLVDSKKVLDNIKIDKRLISDKLIKSKKDLLSKLNTNINSILNKLALFRDYFIKLHNTIGDISDIGEKLSRLEQIKNYTFNDYENALELKKIYNQLNYIRETKNDLKIESVTLCSVSKDDLDKLNSYKVILSDIDNIKYNKINNENTCKSIKNDLKWYKDIKSLFKICPLCGNTIH